MLNCSESLRCGRAARCAVCDGRFGLVRYHSWLLLVPGSASIASELAGQVIGVGCPGPKSPWGKRQRTADHDGPGDAGQLKALADDYQRRAEKASHVDAAKALARSAANAEGERADMT
jgi:hypothetical protein